ncbi:transcriptional regulator, TetR family [Sanguibacter gelidistatuariae]|uniref:Transcriptional regulator, TetR family n=1 Tax=Sanguibacter gelidistatuariae TaxID=1814289 RepID=A0A1G6PPG4_9MICO|nr:hypothetical protein [Sanguibacter gelidistatuariae]SDC82053.1 transcriptional regulator, TetR family [Sanguibacter gelidistatuariae]
MGWTLEERRDRIVDAALQLAADQGIEHVNLRAAAHSAGIAWEAAQEIFDDHTDLLQAMSVSVTTKNISPDTLVLDADGPVAEALEAVGAQVWKALSARRDYQLVSYELALVSLRRTALRSLVTAQYDKGRAFAAAILTAFAEHHGVTWTRPIEEIGRFTAAFLDGVSMAWVVDRDDAAAEEQVRMMAQYLASLVEER